MVKIVIAYPDFQMALWTWVVLSGLIAAADARLTETGLRLHALDIYIPSNLFIVIGISYFTGAAVPAILSLKTTMPSTVGELETARARMAESDISANGQLIVRNVRTVPRFGDIVEGDDVASVGSADLSKVQQLLITLLLVGVHLATLLNLFADSNLLHAR